MSKQAQLPDGTILDFPDNTPDAIMDMRVKEHLTALQTPDKGAVSTDQAKAAFAAKPYGPDDRSPSQVLQDSIGNNLEGVGQFVMGIPGMIKQGGSMIGDAFSPEGMQRNVNRGTQTLDAMGHAVLPMVDNAANLAMNVLNFRSKVPQVTQEQNRASGNFSGQFAAPLIMGAGLSAAPGAAGSLADAIRNRPTMGNVNAMKANAGANFTKALTAARNIPIDLTEPGNAAMQAQQLGSTGAQLPKVISDYAKYPVDPVKPMTYEIGRDFAKNAGDVAYGERALLNEQMKMHVEDFRRAMNDSNRVAAEKAGVVNEYDAAMKEYAKASNLEERNAIIKKWAGRIAVSAALGGTSGMAAKAAWELFHAK